MIDRMQVVVEARQRRFFGSEPAPIPEAALDQQNVQPQARQICAEHEPVMSGADDDAVVSPLQHARLSLRHFGPVFPRNVRLELRYTSLQHTQTTSKTYVKVRAIPRP